MFQSTIVYIHSVSGEDITRYADYITISKPNFHIFIANKLHFPYNYLFSSYNVSAHE